MHSACILLKIFESNKMWLSYGEERAIFVRRGLGLSKLEKNILETCFEIVSFVVFVDF